MRLNCFAGIIILMVILSFSGAAYADSFSDTIATFKKSPVVQPFFKNAYGYAVFPTVGKGGIGIGGAYGKGQVYQGGKVTGTTKLFKATVGLQWGGQAFSEIIFFQDKRAYDDFTGGNFEFDATASAVAITAGAQAKAGTEGATAGASAGPATGKLELPQISRHTEEQIMIKKNRRCVYAKKVRFRIQVRSDSDGCRGRGYQW